MSRQMKRIIFLLVLGVTLALTNTVLAYEGSGLIELRQE